jgi:hypothetical protein
MHRLGGVALLAALIFASDVSLAADKKPPPESKGALSEIKIGVLDHDVGFLSHRRESGIDANLEFLFNTPDWLKFLWDPRPTIGADISTDGGTHRAYAGLTWDFNFRPFYFDFGFGGAYHTGDNAPSDPERSGLGCTGLFRESAALGYRFLQRQSIELFVDHASNWGMCNPNDGMDSLGLRWGYRF